MHQLDARLKEEVSKHLCSRNKNVQKGKHPGPMAFGVEFEKRWLYHFWSAAMQDEPDSPCAGWQSKSYI